MKIIGLHNVNQDILGTQNAAFKMVIPACPQYSSVRNIILINPFTFYVSGFINDFHLTVKLIICRYAIHFGLTFEYAYPAQDINAALWYHPQLEMRMSGYKD